MKKIIIDRTPVEVYQIQKRKIYVKREDLSSPLPGPGFSKVRGVVKVLENLSPLCEAVGVVDTRHSKAGWGVSWLAKRYGVKCEVFYPYFKAEPDNFVRPYQKKCKDFGAILNPLPATKSAVLFYQARKIFMEKYPFGYLFPNGLKLNETISGTSEEVIRTCTANPDSLLSHWTWIISISSATIGAGVIKGLTLMGFRGTVILHMGYSRSKKEVIRYIKQKVPECDVDIQIIDEGYEYKDKVQALCPFPCNPWYDLKAWKWVMENIDNIKGELLFWNIGV